MARGGGEDGPGEKRKARGDEEGEIKGKEKREGENRELVELADDLSESSPNDLQVTPVRGYR